MFVLFENLGYDKFPNLMRWPPFQVFQCYIDVFCILRVDIRPILDAFDLKNEMKEYVHLISVLHLAESNLKFVSDSPFPSLNSLLA